MVLPAALEAWLAGAVVLATASTAALVLAANPRRSMHQYLAFFLLLVAGNYAAQLVQALVSLDLAAGRIGAGEAARLSGLAGQAAALFLVFDPAALAYFASLFPRRSHLAERRWGLPLLGALTLAFLAAELATRGITDVDAPFNPVRLAFFAYFAACYAFAAWRLVTGLLEERSTIMAEQLRVVALGMLVVSLPRVALVLDDVQQTLWPLWGHPEVLARGPGFQLLILAARLLLLAGLAWAFARLVARRHAASEARRADARRALRLAGMVFALFAGLWALNRVVIAWLLVEGRVPADLPGGAREAWYLSELLTFGGRWLVFSAALLHGVVRYEVLAVDRRAVGIAGAALLGTAGSGLVAALAHALGPWAAMGALAAMACGAGAALLAGRGGRARSVAHLAERRLEVYRAALASALAERALPGPAEGRLERLRRRLGLSAREHDALLAAALAEEGAGQGPPTLGRYHVLRPLAEGGHAAVYLAQDGAAGDLVVLKWVRPELAGPRGAGDAALAELEVARRVSHPHLVAIHDVTPVGGGAIVVMEYAEGGSLRELLDRRGPLEPGEARALLRDALAGVVALHEAGIVHGDLKPENLLLTAEGRVKVADFGVARPAPAPPTRRRTLPSGTPALRRRTRRILGTPGYLAPEVLAGRAPTPASDVHALGVIAAEVLGLDPGHAPSGPGLHAQPLPGKPLPGKPLPGKPLPGKPLPGEALPGPAAVPGGWAGLVARATHPDPALRFRDAGEMMKALPGVRALRPGP